MPTALIKMHNLVQWHVLDADVVANFFQNQHTACLQLAFLVKFQLFDFDCVGDAVFCHIVMKRLACMPMKMVAKGNIIE